VEFDAKVLAAIALPEVEIVDDPFCPPTVTVDCTVKLEVLAPTIIWGAPPVQASNRNHSSVSVVNTGEDQSAKVPCKFAPTPRFPVFR
jgi:hypothetical protein